MIVVATGSALRLVTQPDHAHLAAKILGLFRLPELLDHPRREGLLRAVRRHDNGWQELDAAPPVDPASGEPYAFTELPRTHRLAVWERGVARHLAGDPYVALLTAQHALALHQGRGDEPGWRELLPRLAEQREELLARCGSTPDQLAEDYRWLDLADLLSLVACNRWGRPFSRHGFAGALHPSTTDGTDELRVSPFPLAGTTTLAFPCRHLPRRRYAGDADFGGELAAAPWQQARIRLAAGST